MLNVNVELKFFCFDWTPYSLEKSSIKVSSIKNILLFYLTSIKITEVVQRK